jgi:hypothetical protein
MLGDPGDPDRARLLDQETEDPATARLVADRRPLFGVDPGRDELADGAVGSEDP